ncbi:hypothetical protein GQ44DRAFT_764789 [Phaeosphaeriaceae sp. PMI808]|nr:hypothetical protein GQ44DRAFT_764789 [Phaeosphaeriaceae sp. PMI808]
MTRLFSPAQILTLTSHAQDKPCGSSNITLNGIDLHQQWSGDFAYGAGSYSRSTGSVQNERSDQRRLDLDWKSACLHSDIEGEEPAQVLTVNINGIDGRPLVRPSAFTLSFRQQTSPPSLLRLESVPFPSVSDRDVARSWRSPPTYLRLISGSDTTTPYGNPASADQSLEDDIRDLRALQADLWELQQAITLKKAQINSRYRDESKSLTDAINNCDGIACIVKAVAQKAHGAWTIASVGVRPDRDQSQEMGRPENEYAQVHDHTSQKSGGSINVESQPYEIPTELPPRPTKQTPYLIALEVTLSLLCCGCLVAVIRHKCSSLRTRADRAAAREERYTVASYRRAARIHAWRNWWRGNWRKDRERIADYEEKRSLIQSQENILEDAMQEEIRQLRAAHDVVNDLVREAEEGRVIGHAPCNCHRPSHSAEPYSPTSYAPSVASTYPPTSLPDIPSRPQSRTDSLPSYRSDPPSEPPNYDSEVDMSDMVANGFRQYTSSSSSTTSESTSHWTADSSIVDVSPRPSAETLRYPTSILTCEEESEEESDVD